MKKKTKTPVERASIGVDWALNSAVNSKFWETRSGLVHILHDVARSGGFTLVGVPHIVNGSTAAGTIRMHLTFPGETKPYWLVCEYFTRPGSKFYAAKACLAVSNE